MKHKYKYKFIHREECSIQTNILDREFENEFLKITEEGKWIFKQSEEGFAWDGCSPKFSLLGIYFGTPDGVTDEITEKPKTYYASLFHDLVYRNKTVVPISRKESDKIFLLMLRHSKFPLAGLYFFFVRLFGRLYGKWTFKRSQKNIKLISVETPIPNKLKMELSE
ncbi:hypothetical protein [Sediminitomix flava]|uniref:DUF1353 domain-containing protein n=1 Tax=Sediminitomix flava TaxID=379075 RepID=A0A315Z5Q6_SEDFL|nr:hypothetical protein [Sediminitomix flava]PWJ38476.1 hypothetical protein BC781_10766 [Sediminitomix flava]